MSGNPEGVAGAAVRVPGAEEKATSDGRVQEAELAPQDVELAGRRARGSRHTTFTAMLADRTPTTAPLNSATRSTAIDARREPAGASGGVEYDRS